MLLAALASCAPSPSRQNLVVSVVGAPPHAIDPDRAPLDAPSALLARETAQGLVALDANGQIEPALAESWTFTTDGLSAVFRLRSATWPGGKPATAADAAASLTRELTPGSRNRLKPLTSAIDSVVAMTGRVVEVRLRVPRPNLLQLLAQPEFAIRRNGAGTGPWRVVGHDGGALTLALTPDQLSGDPDLPDPDRDVRVMLRGERAARAIGRFQHGEAGFVTGGTLADWPLLGAARIDDSAIRVDGTVGLFGLALVAGRAVTRDPSVRAALAMAIDRDAIGAALGAPRWRSMAQLLPAQFDSGEVPAVNAWAQAPLAVRRDDARRRIAAALHPPAAVVRVYLPPGPGMIVLATRLIVDWRDIGVTAVRVATPGEADAVLIDEVAPNASANWYLTRIGCAYGLACDPRAEAAVIAARAAPSLAARSEALAQADTFAARNGGYIALGQPQRWSLVAPALIGYRDNAFGTHPLRSLRNPG